jgi:biopolymer transport protein ExbD
MNCKNASKWLFSISLFFQLKTGYSQQTDSTADSTLRYYKSTLNPLITSPPKITEKEVNTYANFTIKMTPDSFIVKNKMRILPITSAQQLDKYFKDNISSVRAQEIIIEGSASLKYERFKELIVILSKYELYNFQLVTLND